MGRLCERPGCSELAAVTYGMRAEDLVFWIDAIGDGPGPDRGVLCQRHGESMVVPRGWTLDDLRDPHLHLFRPPPRPGRGTAPRTRRRATPEAQRGEQLALGGMADATHGEPVDGGLPPADVPTTEMPVVAAGADVVDSAVVDGAVVDGVVVDGADVVDTPIATDESPDAPAAAWTPSFDDADDLDGLLAARSPLLSRAFRVTDRRN